MGELIEIEKAEYRALLAIQMAAEEFILRYLGVTTLPQSSEGVPVYLRDLAEKLRDADVTAFTPAPPACVSVPAINEKSGRPCGKPAEWRVAWKAYICDGCLTQAEDVLKNFNEEFRR
jgi:hypothetical protein